jgi:predicted transcriptional regulator
MDLEQIAASLSCDTLCAAAEDGIDIGVVVASDGMSEILAFHRPHALMLTGLTNIQSVRTAIVADVSAIVYVRGKRPSGEVLDLAHERDIPVLCTSLGMFDCCGILYGAGLRGGM